MEIEQHPLEPFLPTNAKLLMLGSFPPQRKRWSMEFYYPNWNNDMWRIVGLIFFGDKEHFVVKGKRAFSKEELIAFLQEKGIALYTQQRLSDACRTMHPTSFWKWYNPRMSATCSKDFSNAVPSSPPAKRLPIHCAARSPLQLPRWATSPNSFSRDVPCVSIACPLPRVPIRWLWTRKRPPIGSCIRTCKCYKRKHNRGQEKK